MMVSSSEPIIGVASSTAAADVHHPDWRESPSA
jgi:hypothetical protein